MGFTLCRFLFATVDLFDGLMADVVATAQDAATIEPRPFIQVEIFHDMNLMTGAAS